MSEGRPRTLGRYEIRGEIGRGSMGVVYEAVDPALDRRVALKAIHVSFPLAEADREAYEQRFLAEAKAAAALSHPGIVVVHDVGRDPASDTLYIALEFLAGRSLAEEIGSSGALEWRRALTLGLQLADALHHAHAQGIVHRDIKPANVMLLPSGRAKIMDFGIARLPSSQLTAAGQFFGTPAYTSPEQAEGGEVDARSDLFSLGCVLYQLLTGRGAFDAPTLPAILLRVLQEDPVAPSRLVPAIPPAVDAIVGRAMAKEREKRYPDGRTLAEDIEDALAGRPPRHTPLPVAEGVRTVVSARSPIGAARGPAPGVGSGSPPAGSDRPGTARPGPPARETEGPLRGAAAEAPSGVGRRRLVAIAVPALALAALGYLVTRHGPYRANPAALPGSPLAPILARGHLEIDVAHPFRRGTVRVWIDDDLALEEPLEGRLTRRVLSFRQYKGRFERTVDVAPGERAVRVEVEGDDGFQSSRRIRGSIESGATRHLYVEVGGIIKKELSLVWGS